MSDFTATVEKQEYQRDPKTGQRQPVGQPVKLSGRTHPISESEWLSYDDTRRPQRQTSNKRRSKAQR